MDLSLSQTIAHDLIARNGAIGALKRTSGAREAMMGIVQFTALERQGSLIQYDDIKFVVSGLDMRNQPPPDPELDTVVFPKNSGNEYKMISPPNKLSPDGVTVMFWELACRK